MILGALLWLAAGCQGDQDLDGDGVLRQEDCDDLDAAVGLAAPYFQDADFDGFGDASVTERACGDRDGWSAVDGDCDDTNGGVNPAETELCNERDDDCDGAIDDGVPPRTFWPDADGDGWGEDGAGYDACAGLEGAVQTGGDCDDADPDVYFGADETCDGVDEDCDGSVDDGVTC